MISRIRYLFSIAFLLFALSGQLTPLSRPAGTKVLPNIVLILADDLGWADVGYHGGNIDTPHIDRLRNEGIALERFYVFPVCTPTRAGLMTGRYPIRFGLMKAVIPPWRDYALHEDEVLMPQVLARAGYKHRGIFGKWHLGNIHVRFTPTRRGFTRFLGHYNGAIDYFTHEREGELDWHDNLNPSQGKGYSTDLIAGGAARFISDHADEGPFFCYVPFNAPHSPFQAKSEDLARYKDLKDPVTGKPAQKKRRIYAAMVDSMDQGIGRILEAIDEAEIRENTLVWFISDNGGTGVAGNNRPLRGRKGQVFEGGIRVPSTVRWPGKIPAGTKSMAPLSCIDVLPTLMRIASIGNHHGKTIDGVDVFDVITGKEKQIKRDIFNYIGQNGEDTEEIALITPTWKLIVRGPNIINSKLDDSKRQKLLFRILDDPEEKTDLSAKNPEKVQIMYQRLLEFRSLQPKDAIQPYKEGRKGFKAPKEWKAPGD